MNLIFMGLNFYFLKKKNDLGAENSLISEVM